MSEPAESGSPAAAGLGDGNRSKLERLRDMRRALENLDSEPAAQEGGPSAAEPERELVIDLDVEPASTVVPEFEWPVDDAGAGPLGASLLEVEQLRAERDSYLEDLQRVGAEFANYRRQADRRIDEASERKLIGLVEKLLPALDALDSAVLQGTTDTDPIRVVLLSALEKEGLEKMIPLGAAFDPNLHDAVMREDSEVDDGEIVVVDVLRAGYLWRGQVVRAAMVKVRG